MWGEAIGTVAGEGNVRKADEIVGASTDRYNTAVGEAVETQHALNDIAARFGVFWHNVIDTTVIPFREFADDMGQLINDREYQLDSGSVAMNMMNIQIKKFKEVKFNSLGNVYGRTKSAGAALAAGIGAGIDAYGRSVTYLDRAEQYASDVDQKIAELERAVLYMRTCIQSYDELGGRLDRLCDSVYMSLEKLEPLVPDFRFDDEYSSEVFGQCGLLVKAIGQLAQISPINEAGELSSECLNIIHSMETHMNTR